MKIIEQNYKWNGILAKRSSTNYIIIHHRAGNGDAESLHAGHLSQGWTGIGYHFYVRKDGSIYRGRPIDIIGAHCTGKNGCSIGVCFEGNYESETMPSAQLRAGKDLVSYLKCLYPGAVVKRHKDMISTACPGKNFPFDDMKRGEGVMTVNDAVETLMSRVGLERQTIDFLLCYKYGEELVKKLAKVIKGA